MPSLRARIKKLAYQHIISDSDRDRIINALDMSEQEPKKGHWIYRNGYVLYKWKCDRCFAISTTDFNLLSELRCEDERRCLNEKKGKRIQTGPSTF